MTPANDVWTIAEALAAAQRLGGDYRVDISRGGTISIRPGEGRRAPIVNDLGEVQLRPRPKTRLERLVSAYAKINIRYALIQSEVRETLKGTGKLATENKDPRMKALSNRMRRLNAQIEAEQARRQRG